MECSRADWLVRGHKGTGEGEGSKRLRTWEIKGGCRRQLSRMGRKGSGGHGAGKRG